MNVDFVLHRVCVRHHSMAVAIKIDHLCVIIGGCTTITRTILVNKAILTSIFVSCWLMGKYIRTL